MLLAQRKAKFELGVSLALHSWQALSIAVENETGGPDSEDRRDSLAGELVDILSSDPNLDKEDLQVILLQAMDDIFNVDLEDESEKEVATLIIRIRRETRNGDFSTVNGLWEMFSLRSQNKKSLRIETQSDSGESVDDDSEEEDVAMDDAPASPPALKVEPQVDGDGFTLVQKRKK